MLKMVSIKFLRFSTLTAVLLAQIIDAKPIMDKSEIEKVALEQHQSSHSCPLHQYFSYELKTCKDCESFCVVNLEEPTCKRQCAAYFLEKELKEKFARKDDEIARLNETIQEIGAKDEEISNSWPIAAQLPLVFGVIIGVASSIIIWKLIKKTWRWRQIQHQDPLNKEEAKLQPWSENRGNRDDDVTEPSKDGRQEEFDFVGGLPTEQDKTFNSSRDDDTSSSHDDNTTVPPNSDVQEEIDLLGGPPAEKA